MRALPSLDVPRPSPPTETAGTAGTTAPWLKLWPDDGWLTITLLASLVYATVLSIQSVTPPWAPGLQILTLTTGVGMLLGYLAAQQGRLPGILVHTVAILLGGAFAFYQTAETALRGDRLALLRRARDWFQSAFEVRGSSDNAVFLLFLAILTFLLAYISFWLVLRTRRPWLAVLANGTVLLINLNWGSDNLLVFLVVFLLVALLLLVRFTLAENMRKWRGRGLRFSPDLTWDFMLAGSVFSVAVLLLAYLLPVGVGNAQVLAYVNDPNGTWQQIQQRVELVFGGVVGPKGEGAGGGLFGSTLALKGNVDLSDAQFLHYTVGADGDVSQYLLTQTYDRYDGLATWSQSQTKTVDFGAGQAEPASSSHVRTTTYEIVYDNPFTVGTHLLFAPGSEPASFSEPATSYVSDSAGVPTSWQAQATLHSGDGYRAEGYVSLATEGDLRATPSPAQAKNAAPTAQYYYDPQLLHEYLDTSPSIASEIQQAARDAAKGTTNMYDAATHIEDYLRTFVYSQHNPEPPADEDHTVWFLHQKQGYCTFFASAMALMGRALGMPTRVVSGYINGSYDSGSRQFIIKGTSAHTWTQIYFAKYGWVNFEPTQSYGKFERSSVTSGPTATAGTTTPGAAQTLTPRARPTLPDDSSGLVSNKASSPLVTILLVLCVVLLALLLLVAGALIWWRSLFRGASPAAALFGRIARLGAWAGAPPERSQTPGEYAERLGALVPGQRPAIRRLGGAYARERYGGGAPPEVAKELPSMYDPVRAALARVISRRLARAPLALLRRGPRRPPDREDQAEREVERVAEPIGAPRRR